jgi:hypothetical protein
LSFHYFVSLPGGLPAPVALTQRGSAADLVGLVAYVRLARRRALCSRGSAYLYGIGRPKFSNDFAEGDFEDLAAELEG